MARALFVFLCAVVAATGYFFSRTWLPALASQAGGAVDRQLTLNFILLGTVFCATQIALGLFLWKYRGKRGAAAAPAATSQPDARVELTWLTLAAVLFLGLNIAGSLLWSNNFAASDYPQKESIWVEVTGTQFRWYFRHPGSDGKFGNTRPESVDASEGNPLGLDRSDAASTDDIVSSDLVIPADKEVVITLRAQDVIHSFFVPALRVKQDAVPGQAIVIHLPPSRAGVYEIACAQLCGMGHYQMNAKLRVVPEAEYRAWLQRSAPKLASR